VPETTAILQILFSPLPPNFYPSIISESSKKRNERPQGMVSGTIKAWSVNK
jgi:hypothetical protein